MSITTAKSNNMKSYLKVLVMFLITIIIALLPPFGAITPLGMKVLGVFVGVLYGWCVLDTLWVSIYAMVILGVLFNNVLRHVRLRIKQSDNSDVLDYGYFRRSIGFIKNYGFIM